MYNSNSNSNSNRSSEKKLYDKNSEIICNNCNSIGHFYYNCKKPIISIGVIAFKIINSNNQYLMVKRKHSFGFVDFIRGKYPVNNQIHLMGLIDEMTIIEKEKILQNTFQELWSYLWGININTQEKKMSYENEKKHSENKFNTLKMGVYLDNVIYNLNDLIAKSNTKWKEPEWGFPKGKRINNEKDIICGFREWNEETGYDRNNLTLIQNLQPYEEIFMGSNYQSYKNKYYIAKFNNNNNYMSYDFDFYEISEVKWLSFEDCLEFIRYYNYEKKKILIKLNNVLNKYSLYP